nr:ribonuclease H-like domain-containing protein [Tanacetum cinerariifolium]
MNNEVNHLFTWLERDDIIITGNNVVEVDKFKVFHKSKFMIKDLGKLKYFLGIEVIDTDKAKTPLMSKLVTSNEASDNDLIIDNITDYHKLMGKLIYFTNTRPDISYVVHCLSQLMHSPLKSLLKIAFKILRYLKSCPCLGNHIVKSSEMETLTQNEEDDQSEPEQSISFPIDIISVILTRLPIKPLLQFRSVSKQWLSLISSPSFAKHHHHHHRSTSLLITTYDTSTRLRHILSVPRATLTNEHLSRAAVRVTHLMTLQISVNVIRVLIRVSRNLIRVPIYDVKTRSFKSVKYFLGEHFLRAKTVNFNQIRSYDESILPLKRNVTTTS